VKALRPRCPNGGKVTFRSPAKARQAAKLARGGVMENLRGRPWRAYKCPYCDGWHLTTQEQRG
jgi:hypothetical protein